MWLNRIHLLSYWALAQPSGFVSMQFLWSTLSQNIIFSDSAVPHGYHFQIYSVCFKVWTMYKVCMLWHSVNIVYFSIFCIILKFPVSSSVYLSELHELANKYVSVFLPQNLKKKKNSIIPIFSSVLYYSFFLNIILEVIFLYLFLLSSSSMCGSIANFIYNLLEHTHASNM